MRCSIGLLREFRILLTTWFFATDLHGRADRYERLFGLIIAERPQVLLLGGDLLPRANTRRTKGGVFSADFVGDYLVPSFQNMRNKLGEDYPTVCLILGNDDPRCEEQSFLAADGDGLWKYMHGRKATVDKFD